MYDIWIPEFSLIKRNLPVLPAENLSDYIEILIVTCLIVEPFTKEIAHFVFWSLKTEIDKNSPIVEARPKDCKCSMCEKERQIPRLRSENHPHQSLDRIPSPFVKRNAPSWSSSQLISFSSFYNIILYNELNKIKTSHHSLWSWPSSKLTGSIIKMNI